MRRRHAMPYGAELDGAGRTRFRLWAPAARGVELCLESPPGRAPLPMTRLDDGWFELGVGDCGAGTRYRFAIDGGQRVPDPVSRAQPDDVHGASEVLDPGAFDWPDGDWRGRRWEETVLYELHVGTFTPEGTFAGVERRLDDLAELGVTAIELMPVSDSPGKRGWGYDGCFPFAPESAFGRPDDLKRLVAAAHARSLMAFLDVVYNHFGPEGNYLHVFAPPFFTSRHQTPWGWAIDFAAGGRAVREFFVHNALYWLKEFHFDGLRFDAVHAIFDESPRHILAEIAETVRAHVDPARHVHLVLENDANEARYLGRDPDGRPRHYVAQWNDDFHHACHVLATGESSGYYGDYAERPMLHLGRTLTAGFAYQGEISPYRDGAPRGEPSAHLPPTAFVNFLQNHDQVGNRAFGERLGALAPAAAVRALAAVLLLAPSPPLLFMGEEWNASQPFLFFCDFGPELADSVREGRRREFARFREFRDERARSRIPDPLALSTFQSSALDWRERERAGRDHRELHRRLLAVRHREIVPRLPGASGDSAGFELYPPRGLVARWDLGGAARLWLAANLGPEPLPVDWPLPEGRQLFASDSVIESSPGRATWPAWFVRWSLAAPAG